MKYSRLRGVKDVLPDESFIWEYIITKAIEIFRRYNYELIIVPTIEEEGLFIRSIGEGTDIVLKEMYNFTDKKGRKIALRPEGTASVVRAFVESPGEKTDFYYIGQMFRYDKPQKGRDREFYQIGVESFGINSIYKDFEIIKLAKDVIENIGIKSFTIHINNLGTRQIQKSYSEAIREFLKQKKENLCEDCKNKLERAPLRILDCKNNNCQEQLKGLHSISDFLDKESIEKYEQFKNLLKAFDINFFENKNLVRGLDYYTGLVFEFVTDKLGPQQNTILAGGRYDNLVEELGGKPTPAIGFAMGIERVCEVLKLEKKLQAEPPYVFIVYDEKFTKNAFDLLFKLRDENFKTLTSFEQKSFKGQMRKANQLNAKYVIILGEEEIKEGVVSVKNMADGMQQKIKENEIFEFLKKQK
jgi:histidyl-tRNA synthetase